ncbi:matrix metalloproteinase-28 isoform X5 [Erinaceus europaeus]|uniref:Matrix metalloproteinase-28 isoform X5 n=1 Tax=Erinaceus europaeus TaxID=9365 RepID=A0ABM3YFT8_ERIEU|nr:matrix metalloproteinase-28 isoform X5 [Erinaceus europaeus]
MAARLGLWLRVLPLLLWGGLDAELTEPVGQELRRDAEAFLEKYGYLNAQVPKTPTSMQFTTAIREFQWVSQLPVSGVLDPATVRQMTRPRCGVADTDNQVAWTDRVSALFAGRRAKMRRKKRFAKQGSKWYKQHLSYRLVNWPQHLPEPAVRGAVHAAFQLWSNVSALEFWEAPATGPADIRLTFFQGDHNDGLRNAFDGPEPPVGGALAHAFLPRRGEAHFDQDERWTLSRRRGRNLFVVLAHEIGHTLGLTHSPAPRALMAPYYKRLGRDALLSWDDVLAVQSLYGNRCWRFRGPKPVWGSPRLCRAGGLPRHPDAALFFPPLSRLILFKGPRYYVLSRGGLQVEPYYPRSLQDWGSIPEEVNGALPWPDGSIFFFRDDHYWRLDQAKLQVTASGHWATELPWMGCWHANSGGELF